MDFIQIERLSPQGKPELVAGEFHLNGTPLCEHCERLPERPMG